MLNVKVPVICCALLGLLACQNDDASPEEYGDLEDAVAENAKADVQYTDAEKMRICQLGQGFSVGRDSSTIETKISGEGYVRLSYLRNDGRYFEYDCRLDGGEFRTRMIDEAGPGTGPGNWSGRGSTTTFTVQEGRVVFREVFSDGSSDVEEFEL